jgi:hypothetical protein
MEAGTAMTAGDIVVETLLDWCRGFGPWHAKRQHSKIALTVMSNKVREIV